MFCQNNKKFSIGLCVCKANILAEAPQSGNGNTWRSQRKTESENPLGKITNKIYIKQVCVKSKIFSSPDFPMKPHIFSRVIGIYIFLTLYRYSSFSSWEYCPLIYLFVGGIIRFPVIWVVFLIIIMSRAGFASGLNIMWFNNNNRVGEIGYKQWRLILQPLNKGKISNVG